MSQSILSRRLRRAGAYVVPRLSFMTFGVMTGLWLMYARLCLDKDWNIFRDTARLVLEGRVHEIYPGADPRLPFLYPPYFIWQILPLGLLSRPAAYAWHISVMTLAMACALLALRATLDAGRVRADSWLFVALSPAGWYWMLITGHMSAWFLMLLSAALFFWTRHRPLWAGVMLSLVMIKPNYGLVLFACVLCSRNWAVLGAVAAGCAALVLSTAALGWRLWAEFAAQLTIFFGAAGMVPAWAQITIFAFWRSCLGDAHPRLLAALWLSCIGPLIVMVGWAWLKFGRVEDRLPRLFGLTVLMLVSCSPYMFQYDGLLLILPGLVWYLQKDSFRGGRAHDICGLAILFIYFWQHLATWILQGGPALIGPAAAVWLVADVLDLGLFGGGNSALVKSPRFCYSWRAHRRY